ALDGIVEGHLHAMTPRRGDHGIEVGKRAEIRLDGFVPSQLVADRPRTTRLVRPSFEAVILPLAIRASDGMNRWQIQYVEPHPGDVGQTLDAIAKRPRPQRLGNRRLRTREEFIPCRKPGRRAID